MRELGDGEDEDEVEKQFDRPHLAAVAPAPCTQQRIAGRAALCHVSGSARKVRRSCRTIPSQRSQRMAATDFPRRTLGRSGPTVSALGLGCMGMSDFYGPSEEATNLATLHHALDIGIDFLDTADMYGVGENERLLGKVLRERRDEVVLATKFGNVRAPDGAFVRIDGSPAYVREACDASLKRLGVDHIDLYYQHRVDRSVPIEETVGAMAELVKAGKV